MNYSFNTEHACAFGVEEAIVLHNLVYWIAKNKANGINEHQGRTWTYSSASAFEKLFPFWNARKISRILASLESQGVILSGNFNKVAYDRTKWYALADESPFVRIDTWKNANCPMDSLDLSNRSTGSVQPIPDINTNRNTDSKPDVSVSDDFDQFWSAYPKKVGKQAARKAWSAKVNKSKPAIEDIIAAVNAAKESKQWQDESGRYIPNPSTWINRHGWHDEADTEKATGSYYDQSKVF
jgi:hypothetical protein